jgi:DNA-binding NarL/FixJ family response regulator
MVKKRPSAAAAPIKKCRASSKSDPKYWRERLFRNTFTHNGNRFQVKHWSVKIQSQGIRKTFSLRSADTDRAALEACELYETIMTRGWQGLLKGQKAAKEETEAGPSQNQFEVEYWRARLIHRKYTEAFTNHNPELSVRIDHGGSSHYFPLGTNIRKLAAVRATQVYQMVIRKGWTTINARFSRELSVAFRWVENPVAWTYTTIHTGATMPWPSPLRAGLREPGTGAKLKVAIAESDPGIRQALAWCINQFDGISCDTAFDNGAAALKELVGRPMPFLIISQSLSDMPGTVCLEKLKAVAPKAAGVIFSIYEDCDQLFKCAPGGAASYLFRRTLPTRILEPISSLVETPLLPRETIADRIRNYFQDTVSSFPVGGLGRELNTLTHREHEILGLLSKGQPDKEIAELLHISTWTVHGHLKRIFEKLRVHNRTEAVLKYLHK